MVKITAKYTGGFKCTADHGPSQTSIITDAPTDIGGTATSFSPTDLVATALITCIMTTMAMVAERNGVKIDGMSGSIEKAMRTTPPRRIGSLTLHLTVPLAKTHPLKEKLEAAASACPVHLSLHPDIIETINWQWAA